MGPAPAATRSYLVLFDWDKSTLTDRARQIIREAADNSTKVQYTRIEVNGYTDTSGTPQYNQGLSVRRARAVQAELVKDGVPQNAITIQGFGDTNCWFRPAQVCVSRRTGGWRSSFVDAGVPSWWIASRLCIVEPVWLRWLFLTGCTAVGGGVHQLDMHVSLMGECFSGCRPGRGTLLFDGLSAAKRTGCLNSYHPESTLSVIGITVGPTEPVDETCRSEKISRVQSDREHETAPCGYIHRGDAHTNWY